MLHVLHCTSIVCISGRLQGTCAEWQHLRDTSVRWRRRQRDGNISMPGSGCRLGKNEHAQGHVNHPQSLPNVLNLKQAAPIRSKAKCAALQIPHWTTIRLLTCLKTTKMTNSEPGIYGRYARQRSKINHRARIWSSAEGDAQAFHWLGMTTQGEQAVG